MRMKESLEAIYKVVTTDETLLRLLYYKPVNQNDNPLDMAKENIIDKPALEKWDIINDIIKKASKIDGLDSESKCRVCFYSGIRNGGRNYMLSKQDIIFDIYVHFDFEEMDFRASWICDRVSELIFDKDIIDVGKIFFKNGGQINAPTGYIGYRLIFNFEDIN